jgi:hypothetical protein
MADSRIHIITFGTNAHMSRCLRYVTADETLAEQMMSDEDPLFSCFFREMETLPAPDVKTVDELRMRLERLGSESATPLRRQAIEETLREADRPLDVSELRASATEKLSTLIDTTRRVGFGHGQQIVKILQDIDARGSAGRAFDTSRVYASHDRRELLLHPDNLALAEPYEEGPGRSE